MYLCLPAWFRRCGVENPLVEPMCASPPTKLLVRATSTSAYVPYKCRSTTMGVTKRLRSALVPIVAAEVGRMRITDVEPPCFSSNTDTWSPATQAVTADTILLGADACSVTTEATAFQPTSSRKSTVTEDCSNAIRTVALLPHFAARSDSRRPRHMCIPVTRNEPSARKLNSKFWSRFVWLSCSSLMSARPRTSLSHIVLFAARAECKEVQCRWCTMPGLYSKPEKSSQTQLH